MRISLGTLLLASTLAGVATPAGARTGEPIGSTVLVVNRVTAELEREERTLRKGDGVRQDEVIDVAPNGRGELQLNDETKLALGPGSRLTLDKFVYDPQQTSGSIVLNMIKGTFRFVTGIASKPSYLIRVPNASITVRGTIFDVSVRPNGEVWALLHEGAFEACVDGGACRVVDQPGTLIRISGGNIAPPTRWTQMPGRRNASFDQAFPFVARAPQIDPVPIFTREAILLGRIPLRPRRPGGTHDGPGPGVDPGRNPGPGPGPNTTPPKGTHGTPTKTKTGRILGVPKPVTKRVKVIKKPVVKHRATTRRQAPSKRVYVKRKR